MGHSNHSFSLLAVFLTTFHPWPSLFLFTEIFQLYFSTSLIPCTFVYSFCKITVSDASYNLLAYTELLIAFRERFHVYIHTDLWSLVLTSGQNFLTSCSVFLAFLPVLMVSDLNLYLLKFPGLPSPFKISKWFYLWCL